MSYMTKTSEYVVQRCVKGEWWTITVTPTTDEDEGRRSLARARDTRPDTPARLLRRTQMDEEITCG